MIKIGDVYFGTYNPPTKTRRKSLIIELRKKQKKRCFYCSKKVTYKGIQEDGRLLHNAATLEHIYHKRDIRRAIENPIVLCCYSCNQKRNEEYESFYRSIDQSQPIIDIKKFIKYSKRRLCF